MPVTPLEATLSLALTAAFDGNFPDCLGVAVSGGGDSMALLDMLRRWDQVPLAVVSVNHGLRDGAAGELALVSDYAAQHGLSHDILNWQWDGSGNLQKAAREGRRSMIAQWAKARNIAHVALGHTKDDQAETFLMRLARGSGVEGLACMAGVREDDDVFWVRPLLNVGRDELRAYLRAHGLTWADDPSNEDTRFDRVKARQMMATLAPLGITVDRLAQTAAHMRREREVATWATNTAAQNCVTLDAGDVMISRDRAVNVPEAVLLRIVADGLSQVSGAVYRPRFRALQAAIVASQPVSLHGCLILPSQSSWRITREWAAIQTLRSSVYDVWDKRWRLIPPAGTEVSNLEVAALGELGIAQLDSWRSAARPRQSILSSPAVWQGDTVIAAPLAGAKNGWEAILA
ncbi:tRNA lysidine(34) synthetase TilS [Shimia sp.]|uniref:tRNA lysidine(34) synthetase TilS n=1 Tax=Shimia sp. TaxID=1954381 RepID=UPI003B8CE13D